MDAAEKVERVSIWDNKRGIYVLLLPVTLARGENVKLLLEDAGLDHEYVRLNRTEGWAERRAKLVEEGFFSPTLPYIEVGGKRFGKTVPIMRYISVKLGNKYHGSTAEENQYLDYISDITNDWFEHMKKVFFGSDVSICLDSIVKAVTFGSCY